MSSSLPLEEPTTGTLEQRFDRARHRVGLVVGPLLFAGLLFWPPGGLGSEAQRLAAILAVVIVWWITEPVPMAVTALLGAAACVVLQVAPAKMVFAPFSDPLMFLFIGSFMLSRAIFLQGLDRKLADGVLSQAWVDGRPERVLFLFGLVTVVLSGWMSNTATTAMMFAIGLSLLGTLREESALRSSGSRYATCLMLMTSFAATIGGLATPIGTPPNLIGLGIVRSETGVEITFFEWMMLGVPITGCLYAVLFVFLNLASRRDRPARLGTETAPTSAAPTSAAASTVGRNARVAAAGREGPGAWTVGQRSTVVAFAVTATLWILPGLVALVGGEGHPAYRFLRQSLPESVVALLGAGLLFFLPGSASGAESSKDGPPQRALTWRDAVRIDWGILLLYGGGLSLGTLADATGLAGVIGRSLAQYLPANHPWALLVAATLVATLVSELTSNTASVTVVVPLAIAIARESHSDPLLPALGATFGSSLGFMLPVSTPCNAIVYSSGLIPLSRMMAYGALLDVMGAATIIVVVGLFGGWVR